MTLGQRVPLVRKDPKEVQDHRDLKVLPGHKALLAHRDRRDRKDRRDRPGHRALRELG